MLANQISHIMPESQTLGFSRTICARNDYVKHNRTTTKKTCNFAAREQSHYASLRVGNLNAMHRINSPS